MRSEYVAKAARKYIVIAILFLFISLLIFLALYGPHFLEFKKLEINRAKWASQNITHYRFDLELICYCPYTFATIEVQDGQIVSMVNSNGTALTQGSSEFVVFQNVGTVENLFDRIQKKLVEAYVTIPTYDSKYGFPTSIRFDQLGLHSDITYTITNFEVLP